MAFLRSLSSDSWRIPAWRQRVRFAAELGYEVTVVSDAIASFTNEQMHAALHSNLPNYAHAMVTTDQLADSISSF